MSDATAEKPRPSTWQRSTTRRFFVWLFSARTLRRGLITLAWVVTLLAFYYGVVDWKGRRDWNAFRVKYQARVGSLDFQSYIPKPIPDAENFAAIPFVRSWLNTNDKSLLYSHDAWSQANNMVYNPKHAPPVRQLADPVAWQEAFAARGSEAEKPRDGFRSDKLDLASRSAAAHGVLNAMKDDDAAIEELREASSRPESRYDVKYNFENPWATMLPHLIRIKQTCLRLQTKACAELAAGQSESAQADVKLSFYVADSVDTEPFFISYLVHIACIHLAVESVWEGLAERRWSDTELKQIQDRLAGYNWLEDLEKPLHAECAMGGYAVEVLKKRGLGFLFDATSLSRPDNKPLNFVGRIIPSGWYDEEMVHYCQKYEDEFRGAMDVSAKRVFPQQVTVAANEFERTRAIGPWRAIVRHECIARIMLPALNRLPIKAAAAQTAVDEAAIACALERYRLANAAFPENLQALVPSFAAPLPNDVITGEPLKYRRTDDGRFVLYSVGWNETDDGGIAGKTLFDEIQGDWIWEYPAKL